MIVLVVSYSFLEGFVFEYVSVSLYVSVLVLVCIEISIGMYCIIGGINTQILETLQDSSTTDISRSK